MVRGFALLAIITAGILVSIVVFSALGLADFYHSRQQITSLQTSSQESQQIRP